MEGRKVVKTGRERYPFSPASLRSPDSWVGPERGQIVCQSQRKEDRRAAKASRSGWGSFLF